MPGLQCPLKRGIPSSQDKFLPKIYEDNFGMAGVGHDVREVRGQLSPQPQGRQLAKLPSTTTKEMAGSSLNLGAWQPLLIGVFLGDFS